MASNPEAGLFGFERKVLENTVNDHAREVLIELGFPPLCKVEGRLSIADLYPSQKKRCGIYVLEHSDGMQYVGQSIDVVRRFGQRRKTSSAPGRIPHQRR